MEKYFTRVLIFSYDGHMNERRRKINSLSARAVLLLSCIALLAALSGYTEPPQTDEGTAAHIFQISIVLLAPAILTFLATADWNQPLRSLRALAIPATALVIAFGALYYLENYRDPNYHKRASLLVTHG